MFFWGLFWGMIFLDGFRGGLAKVGRIVGTSDRQPADNVHHHWYTAFLLSKIRVIVIVIYACDVQTRTESYRYTCIKYVHYTHVHTYMHIYTGALKMLLLPIIAMLSDPKVRLHADLSENMSENESEPEAAIKPKKGMMVASMSKQFETVYRAMKESR